MLWAKVPDQHLRALPVLPAGPVRHRQDQSDRDLRPPDPRLRQRPRLRDLPARRKIDLCLALERERCRTEPPDTARHERTVPRQHSARVPAGEITPEKLIALGPVARKYGLFTKITGAQRVALFGDQAHRLPSIWEELIAHGFESGHACVKALRTIKSCVGTTCCRYGVQDSAGFAVRIEKRYRGIRAPHNVQGTVPGSVRECAEAPLKDIGLIATETGYNLYVYGNGGATPRHAGLLAPSLDEETAIRYIDPFFM